jgi:hypothetical protein
LLDLGAPCGTVRECATLARATCPAPLSLLAMTQTIGEWHG